MDRWYQFHDGHTITFGLGTESQARRHRARLDSRMAVNHYVMTALNEGEEPFANSVIIDLDSGDRLPTIT